MTNTKLNVIYMGTPGFAVAPLEAILKSGHRISAVVTVPDKPAGRGRKVQSSAVKDFAIDNNLPVLQPEKLRDEDFVNGLKSLQPDVIVIVAFRMLPKVVWEIPRLGTFNLHASLLPQYRGAAPINWAVMNNEKESGVTTFLIDDKIDTGEILLQEKVELVEDETAGSLHDKLMVVGANLVVKTLDGLSEGKLHPQKQEQTNSLKSAPKIFREDCKIDWSLPGEKIESQIRGLSPYPAAFTLIDGDEVSGSMKITEAKFHAGESHAEFPILKIDGKLLKVLLPNGYLVLNRIQIQGKRAMNAADFINGIRDKSQVVKLK